MLNIPAYTKHTIKIITRWLKIKSNQQLTYIILCSMPTVQNLKNDEPTLYL